MSTLPGFSLIVWVKEDSTLIQNVSDNNRDIIIREILGDVETLIGHRWNLDVIIQSIQGTTYAYTNNTRFNVSGQTLKNALGDLTDHVEFQKGSCNCSAEQLVRYRMTKLKWKVPDQVTDPSISGWGEREQEQTSHPSKRKRY